MTVQVAIKRLQMFISTHTALRAVTNSGGGSVMAGQISTHTALRAVTGGSGSVFSVFEISTHTALRAVTVDITRPLGIFQKFLLTRPCGP